MSAAAVVPGWMGSRIEVRDDLPPDCWCLISGSTLYVARGRLGMFRPAFPGLCVPVNERLLSPDLDSPRDAAPEGWR